MTGDERFSRTLSAWLDQDAAGRVPRHLEDVLLRTAATRQRSRWSIRAGWGLVSGVDARRTGLRAPALGIAVAAALLVVAALALALVAGSRRSPAPAFGPAANGVLVLSDGGDILALDPAEGRSTTLVGGPDIDRSPVVSRDGTRIVFDRALPGGRHQLMTAGIDGQGVRPIGGPMSAVDEPVWSPDGTRIALDAEIDGRTGIRIVGLDGAERLVLPQDPGSATQAVDDVQWRNDGAGLVFRGWQPGGDQFGLWTIEADGSGLRRILPTSVAAREPLFAALSPDGGTIAYTFADEGRIRLAEVATGRDVPIAFEGSEGGDSSPVWAPDGTRLAFSRLHGGVSRIAVGLAGGGPVSLLGPPFADDAPPAYAFSPDGTRLIVRYPADGSTWLLDPSGASAQRLDVGSTSLPAWQRQAP